MSVTLIPEYPPEYSMIPPWLEMQGSAAVTCTSSSEQLVIPVTIHGDAPPGPITIRVDGTTSGGETCESEATIEIIRSYAPIEIMYKTFISCEVAGPTPRDFTLYDFFRGDNRGFGYAFGVSASRTYQRATVTIDPSNTSREIGTPIQLMGITQGFDDDPLAVPTCGGQCSHSFVQGSTPECTGTTKNPVNAGMLAISVTPVDTFEIRVLVTNRAQDQCESAVPGIDVNLTLSLRQICQGGLLLPVEFTATGSYDGYPWHEVYLNGVTVFTHDPCVSGDTPNSMFPWPIGTQYDFQVQEPAFLDWRPVP